MSDPRTIEATGSTGGKPNTDRVRIDIDEHGVVVLVSSVGDRLLVQMSHEEARRLASAMLGALDGAKAVRR